MIPDRLLDRLRGQAGYTLVEMVSFTGIIGLLSALVIANVSFGDRRQELRDGAGLLVTAARQAESAAVSSQGVIGSDGTATARRAYGVCFTSRERVEAKQKCKVPIGAEQLNAFQVYARQTTEQADPATGQYQNPALTEPDIISSYQLVGKQRLAGSYWLDYQPPTPKLTVNGQNLEQTIRLEFTDSDDYYREIVVRPLAGAIYVQ